MKSAKPVIPENLKVMVELGFDYDEDRISGGNYYGHCIFCGKNNKLYINPETGQWDCKVCGLGGNVYSFLREYYKLFLDSQDSEDQAPWEWLSKNRKLPAQVLKDAGIVYDGTRYIIPVRNVSGSIVNFKTYRQDSGKLFNLPGLEASLFGLELFSGSNKDTNNSDTVYICAGEWDAIALRDLLSREGRTGIAVGVPGEKTWKQTWTDILTNRPVIVLYDNDTVGTSGTEKVYYKLKPFVSSVSTVKWPVDLPEGFDIRDFVTRDGTFTELQQMIFPMLSEKEREQLKLEEINKPLPLLSSKRPKFQEVLDVYRRHFHMSKDLEDALRCIFAVVLTVQMKHDPVWMHIVAPPGSLKTVMLMSTSQCPSCYMVSTLTNNALVSGWGNNKEDPSLIPKLDNKVLVVKDYTEILSMPKVLKDELFGTLRGAFDGEVSKQYGNGVIRNYKVHFNMVTGVTQQIFSDRSASLGERFIMFHVIKGVGFNADNPIRSAIRNIGKKEETTKEIGDIAKRFLDVTIEDDQMPVVSEWLEDRIIALSQIVAMLRGSVERDIRGDRKLLVRPQHEMGTRLAVQFTKLIMGMGLLNTKPSIGEEEYAVLVRVAIDTCVGFNLEAIASLVESPGQTVVSLAADCNLPITTLRDQVEDLKELGAIRVEKVKNPAIKGAPVINFYVTDRLLTLWKQAGLVRVNGSVKSLSIERKKLMVRTRRFKLNRKARRQL